MISIPVYCLSCQKKSVRECYNLYKHSLPSIELPKSNAGSSSSSSLLQLLERHKLTLMATHKPSSLRSRTKLPNHS